MSYTDHTPLHLEPTTHGNVNMAENGLTSAENDGSNREVSEEVFVNGESEVMGDRKETEEEDVQTSQDDTVSNEPMLPRKSSFMCKDGRPRKKTVSFSSMPTERKIATGKI